MDKNANKSQNGARPKSSTKTEKTETKKELVPERTNVKLLIMNFGPKSSRCNSGNTDRRRKAVQMVFQRYEPELGIFQEFPFACSLQNKWKYAVPHATANPIITQIVYDSSKLVVEKIPDKELQTIENTIKGICQKKSIKNEHFHNTKMCLQMVKKVSEPNLEFICISWHGPRKLKETNRIEIFKCLMIIVTEIYKQFQLPLLICGDFNVERDFIKEEVPSQLKLHPYEASERREKNGIIDYAISTTNLKLLHIKQVNLKEFNDSKLEDLLDHDPITAELEYIPEICTPLTENLHVGEITDNFANLNIGPENAPFDSNVQDSETDKAMESLGHDSIRARLEPVLETKHLPLDNLGQNSEPNTQEDFSDILTSINGYSETTSTL